MTSLTFQRFARVCSAIFLIGCLAATAQHESLVVDRAGTTVAIEPYASNIVRVTISKEKDRATAAAGYGFIASPSSSGWRHENESGDDFYRSDRLVVQVAASKAAHFSANDLQLMKFFDFSNDPQQHITVSTADGKMLVDLLGWSVPEPGALKETHPRTEPSAPVSATFASPLDEHFYGLGQNQEGSLDHRDHTVNCWHDYGAPGGESVCVPFMVSSRGYGLIWDNPSKTTIQAGFNERTGWTSHVGDRISFFVIAGNNTDEIYSGYRMLTGPTPMLPKAAYGFMQSKQRYDSQAEILAVAKGYRERHLPADYIVVDFLYYTKMGQMDMDPNKWPDPEAMNRQLHDMGFKSMISVWPHFARESRFHDMIEKKGWFVNDADGTPTNGRHVDRVGPNLDTTNPDAAKWFWSVIRDNYVKKGFDAVWLDETEPDTPPDNSYFSVGPGQAYYNVYPLFHTASVYDGWRKDSDKRALILSRAAYLGAQRNATVFWSSDIYSSWDTLKRQVPAGLDFAASGMPYWCNDVGGFLPLPAEHHPLHAPLIDPTDARANVGGYDDYPELYVRWYQYGAFQPIFRTHGTRNFNEIWSYGKQAEPILEKYLKLRYQLLPYIYSLGYQSHETGAPYMRALFMDFPNDPNVAEIGDEYMFGPAFLVAPVTDQGATSRSVYLPAGAKWYNFWTNELFEGGKTITVKAPIDTIPLFVRAGSILPLGSAIESTEQKQDIAKIRIYPGANGAFSLYDDDGKTYAYETGDVRITRLSWDDAMSKFSADGAKAWTEPDRELVEIVKSKTGN
ncbi:MAG TPA: glycoside hydrolase family 31 protein [Terracidiphilus sp.]